MSARSKLLWIGIAMFAAVPVFGQQAATPAPAADSSTVHAAIVAPDTQTGTTEPATPAPATPAPADPQPATMIPAAAASVGEGSAAAESSGAAGIPQEASPAVSITATPAQATTTPAQATTTPAQATTTPAPSATAQVARVTTPEPKGKVKGKKAEYTGPNEIVVLPPTPMLDDEGKQQLDPDGKPMFNPPVKQQRDKHGHPLFTEAGKPTFQTANDLGYDEKGKKLHAAKEKKPKLVPVSVSRGTMTVDGMIGKAALNYEIADLKYIYLFAPGIGIAVISNEPFPGAKEQRDAFNDRTLTVNVGEHTLQLASDKRLLGKKPEAAYVLLDREFTLPSPFPVVGYGTLRKPPYAWPGSKQNAVLAGAKHAPPPPMDLMPVLLLKPCPAGMMRPAGPKVLPGQTAPVQPCIPIPKATPVAAVKTTAVTTAATPSH